MLEENEWEVIEPLLHGQIRSIKNYRGEHGVDLETAVRQAYKPATDKYYELTGYEETNYAAIMHHRLNDFGDECVKCKHLLRTPRASFCANCGHKGKENA